MCEGDRIGSLLEEREELGFLGRRYAVVEIPECTQSSLVEAL